MYYSSPKSSTVLLKVARLWSP